MPRCGSRIRPAPAPRDLQRRRGVRGVSPRLTSRETRSYRREPVSGRQGVRGVSPVKLDGAVRRALSIATDGGTGETSKSWERARISAPAGMLALLRALLHTFHMIKALARALVALNSNVKREQIAGGFACGVLLALIPPGNLLFIAIFAAVYFTKVNYGMQLLVTGIIMLAKPLLAPALDALGWGLLNAPPLQGLFTTLYNLPLAPLTRFNNTLVAGGLVAGLALWFPLFFAARTFVPWYRARLGPRISGSKLYKAFKRIPLVQQLAGAVSAATGVAGALE